ncbi:MAG: hypothetical protein ACRD0J_01890 [Acidimicrobiales bacterium]
MADFGAQALGCMVRRDDAGAVRALMALRRGGVGAVFGAMQTWATILAQGFELDIDRTALVGNESPEVVLAFVRAVEGRDLSGAALLVSTLSTELLARAAVDLVNLAAVAVRARSLPLL